MRLLYSHKLNVNLYALSQSAFKALNWGVALRLFAVITCAIVWAEARVIFTGIGTGSSVHVATGFAQGNVVVTNGAGAVDHSAGGCAATVANRYCNGIYVVDRNRDAVIEHVALTVKIFATRFQTVAYNAAMKLVNIFKSLRQQIGRCFFAFNASRAVGDYLFIPKRVEFMNVVWEFAQVFHVERDGALKFPDFMFVIRPHIDQHYIRVVFQLAKILGFEVNAGLSQRIDG